MKGWTLLKKRIFDTSPPSEHSSSSGNLVARGTPKPDSDTVYRNKVENILKGTGLYDEHNVPRVKELGIKYPGFVRTLSHMKDNGLLTPDNFLLLLNRPDLTDGLPVALMKLQTAKLLKQETFIQLLERDAFLCTKKAVELVWNLVPDFIFKDLWDEILAHSILDNPEDEIARYLDYALSTRAELDRKAEHHRQTELAAHEKIKKDQKETTALAMSHGYYDGLKSLDTEIRKLNCRESNELILTSLANTAERLRGSDSRIASILDNLIKCSDAVIEKDGELKNWIEQNLAELLFNKSLSMTEETRHVLLGIWREVRGQKSELGVCATPVLVNLNQKSESNQSSHMLLGFSQ